MLHYCVGRIVNLSEFIITMLLTKKKLMKRNINHTKKYLSDQ